MGPWVLINALSYNAFVKYMPAVAQQTNRFRAAARQIDQLECLQASNEPIRTPPTVLVCTQAGTVAPEPTSTAIPGDLRSVDRTAARC